nr:hypothetical protein 3 [bacterium]
MKKSILIICSVLLIIPRLIAAENIDREKLIRLDMHLSNIEKTYAFSRNLGGGSLTVMGVGVGILGIVITNTLESEGFIGAESKSIGYLISVGFGGIFAIPGGIIWAFPTEYEKKPQEFQKLPETNDDELIEKIARGEVILQSLADTARITRYISGATGVITGLGELLVALIIDENQGLTSYYSPRLSLISTGMGLVAGGAVALLFKSQPENEFDAYQKWLER